METAVTLASVPAIMALVNLAKPFGVSGKWAALLAVVLGAALSALDAVATGGNLYTATVTGCVLGLSAAGLYDTAQIASSRSDIPGADLDEPEGIIDIETTSFERTGIIGDIEGANAS